MCQGVSVGGGGGVNVVGGWRVCSQYLPRFHFLFTGWKIVITKTSAMSWHVTDQEIPDDWMCTGASWSESMPFT